MSVEQLENIIRKCLVLQAGSFGMDRDAMHSVELVVEALWTNFEAKFIENGHVYGF